MENSLLTAATLLTREAAETAKQAVHYEATPPQGPSLTFPIPRDSSGTLLLDHGAGARLLFGSIVSYRVLGSDEELRRYIQPLATAVGTPPHPLDHLTPPRDAAYYAPVTDYRVLGQGGENFYHHRDQYRRLGFGHQCDNRLQGSRDPAAHTGVRKTDGAPLWSLDGDGPCA